MKKKLFLFVVLMVLLAGCGLIAPGIIGAGLSFKEEPTTFAIESPPLNAEKVVFLPKPEQLRKYGYSYSGRLSGRVNISYEQLVGKTAHVLDPLEEGLGKNLRLQLEDGQIIFSQSFSIMGTILAGVAFVSELEGAQKYVGNTVRYKRGEGGHRYIGYESIPVGINNLEQFTVIRVTYGLIDDRPLCFWLQREDGSQIDWHGLDSGINIDKKRNLRSPFFFEEFYLEDPKQLHPDWSEEIWQLVQQRKIRIGMTCDMLLLSWGKPTEINRSVGSWGTHEQFVYRDYDSYVYVENGKITSWQN